VVTDRLVLELTARAYVLLEKDDRVDAILVGFHGYGESPERTMEALRQVDVPNLLRVAPMGQHHFYDRHGNVVASWMTRFERDHQIEQQLGYVSSLHEALRARYPGVPLFVLGFSQGTAIAYRAAVLAGLTAGRIFCLAGDMPPEVRRVLGTKPPVPVTLLWGKQDRVVDPSAMEADLHDLVDHGWPAELHVVPGGHEYAIGALQVIAHHIRESLG
jgi:predicted esterase